MMTANTQTSYKRAVTALLKQSNQGTFSDDAAEGGVIQLGEGVIETTEPLEVYSGFTVRGAAKNATVIRNLHGGATFLLKSQYGFATVNEPTIESLRIHAPKGGQGIAVDPKVSVVERASFRHLSIRTPGGWAMSLVPASRCYFTTIENVDFANCWGALLHEGMACSWLNSRVQGEAKMSNRPAGMIEHRGYMSVEGGASRFEGSWGCPMFHVRPYAQDSGPATWASTLLLYAGHYEVSDASALIDAEAAKLVIPWTSVDEIQRLPSLYKLKNTGVRAGEPEWSVP